MKKKIILTWLLALALAATAGTGFAASSFVDVNEKHWAYDSINKLVSTGVIEGYQDGYFRGDKPLSRYEFAVATAKAIDNYNKADDAEKSEILKLVAEFSKELDSIDARLGKVEQKVGSVKFSGDSRIRYQHNYGLNGKSNGQGADASRSQLRLRLTGDAVLDQNWSVSTRFGVQNTTGQTAGATGVTLPAGAEQGSNNGQVFFDRAEFKYSKDAFTGTIGRSTLFLGQGLLYDFAFDGFTAGYASGKLTSKLLLGDASLTRSAWAQNVSGGAGTAWNQTEKFWGADFKYAFNPKLFATATAYQSTTAGYPYKDIALGINATLGDFRLLAEGVRNTYNNYGSSHYQGTTTSADAQKNGYWVDLRWKFADVNKPGSWSTNVRYVSLGKDAIDGPPTTLNWVGSSTIANGGGTAAASGYGIKGYELGGDYILAKGADLRLAVGKYKPYDKNYAGFDSYNTVATATLFFNF